MTLKKEMENKEFISTAILWTPNKKGNVFVTIQFQKNTLFKDQKGEKLLSKSFHININNTIDNVLFKDLGIVTDLQWKKHYPSIKLIEWDDFFLCVCGSANFIGENYFKISKKDLVAYIIENNL